MNVNLVKAGLPGIANDLAQKLGEEARMWLALQGETTAAEFETETRENQHGVEIKLIAVEQHMAEDVSVRPLGRTDDGAANALKQTVAAAGPLWAQAIGAYFNDHI